MGILLCNQLRVNVDLPEMETDEIVPLTVIEQMKAEHPNEIRSEEVVREIKHEDLLVGRVQDGKLRLGLTDWPRDLA